jgi:hypothetical protein
MLPAATAAAQEQQEAGENEANLYVATVYVNRVYTHRLGYKVLYQQQDLSLGEVYLPNSWFSKAAGRAELINTRSTAAPYMEIYYNNGEFAYVRLYVRRNPNHVSWGSLRPGEAPEEAFDQETLNISY